MAPDTGRLPTEQALEEILAKSLHRWLRPFEIHKIFENYQKLGILISEPQERPPSGSFFIIKRHLLRVFRKDGHNWKKKGNKKTVVEFHEELMVEGVPMLQCYYAHGEENEDFQRRIYWMLQGEPSDIVLLHYLQTERNKRRRRRGEEIVGERPTSSLPDWQQNDFQALDLAANSGSITSESLHIRFEEMLCLKPVCRNYNRSYLSEALQFNNILEHLLKEDDEEEEEDKMAMLFSELKISSKTAEEKFCQKILKKKLHPWLLQKVIEGGSDLTKLDNRGQGALHFAAALGYDWAVNAILAAGVDVNFRDVNRWTPLHWAAVSNREEMVRLLMWKNADTEAQSSIPYGKTPADLAYDVGWTDIANYIMNLVKLERLYRNQLHGLGAERDDTGF